jgi:hypothetical protein
MFSFTTIFGITRGFIAGYPMLVSLALPRIDKELIAWAAIALNAAHSAQTNNSTLTLAAVGAGLVNLYLVPPNMHLQLTVALLAVSLFALEQERRAKQ